MFIDVTTKYVCGIDLHARTMSLCVMDKNGKMHLRKSIPCDIHILMDCLKPYRQSITVGVESTFNWYWLIDGLSAFKVPCHLGHALYIKQMSGKKHKNDPVDARGIADLLRTNRFPPAYAYPAEMRSTRDLLRRRHFFVRRRAGTYTHLQNTLNQHGNMKSFRADVHRKSDRRTLVDLTSDPEVQKILSCDFDYIESLDSIIDDLENVITGKAHHHDRKHFKLLQTIPGCGAITALTVLYETHTIERFASAQCYSSYARVVRADNESGGSSLGRSSNDKIGNPYLKWSLSEIGTRMVNQSVPIRQWYDKQVAQHGTGGTMARLRHKIAIAIFFMMKHNIVFDEYKFLGIEKDRSLNPATNRKETSGQASEPSALIGKRTGLFLRLMRTKTIVRGKRKLPGRLSLRTTGKRKVRTTSKSLGG
jgi:transposase